MPGPERVLWKPLSYVMTVATTVFSNHGPPPPIVDRIGAVAPRPVFLIYADPGMGGETARQPKYLRGCRRTEDDLEVPGAKHTGGFDARPAEYERRVIAFFDRALIATDGGAR